MQWKSEFIVNKFTAENEYDSPVIKRKFVVGQIVNCPPTLHGETSGEIVETTRIFKEIDPKTGKFKRNGLCTDEKIVVLFKTPYTFDGETLTMTYKSGMVETSKFFDFSYTVKTPTMLTSFYEKKLLKLNK